MPSRRETGSVGDVAVISQYIYITSNSNLRAVLTKNGIWYVSVLAVTSGPTISILTNLSTRGNSAWFSLSQESIQSWLSGERDLTSVVADVIIAPKMTNALFGVTVFVGMTTVRPSYEGTED